MAEQVSGCPPSPGRGFLPEALLRLTAPHWELPESLRQSPVPGNLDHLGLTITQCDRKPPHDEMHVGYRTPRKRQRLSASVAVGSEREPVEVEHEIPVGNLLVGLPQWMKRGLTLEDHVRGKFS